MRGNVFGFLDFVTSMKLCLYSAEAAIHNMLTNEHTYVPIRSFPGGSEVKASACNVPIKFIYKNKVKAKFGS